MATDLTIPREFKRRTLEAMPRRRVAKVVLYGSRARGDARRDSD
jgi:predicted nucleotidyltransferase